MARQRGQRLNFTFVKGWNTEASPMTFPDNTASDIDNVILDIDGSIRRRAGADFDAQTTKFGSDLTSYFSTRAIGFHDWTNVNGSSSTAFAITQFGTTLYFHKQAGQSTIDNLIDSVDFSAYATDGAGAVNSVVEVIEGLGYLFVVGKYIEPFYCTYDEVSGTISTTQITIEIRDYEGVDDGLAVDTRPSSISTLHRYNLLNQGWPSSRITASYGGKYPSNADIVWYGKKDDGTFSTTLITGAFTGNTPASKGYYILNAFNKNRSAASGLSIATDSIDVRPTTVAFHNGRTFYSGVDAVGRAGEIYYSQLLTEIDRAGNCYQRNSPTAEEFNELLATDGGVIVIPDSGQIVKIIEGPRGIVVFADNGVWEVTGPDNNFDATNFFARKIDDLGCVSAESVVSADGSILYWSDSGIIMLTPDQISGNLVSQNLTQTTIQTGYLVIGGAQRRQARGTFIPEEKKVIWLYNTSSSFDGVTDRFKYNGILILDTQLGAFYKYSISDINADAPPFIAGVIKTIPFETTVEQELVTAGGTVVTAGGVDVTLPTIGFGDLSVSSWKLLMVRPDATNYAFTFGEFSSRSFTDWYLSDGVGVDYSSYIETGFDTAGAPSFDKQPTYVYTYLSRASKSLGGGNGYYTLPELPAYI